MHPGGEPNLISWTDRPDSNVVGRWGSNASCVAISSNCIIAVRHAEGGIGTYVEIGGNTYIVTDVWNHSTADIRVARLYGANLINFVGLYEDTNEIDKEIVMGGYGDGRGGLLKTRGTTYGYQWDNSSNTTLRLGTNKINDTKDDDTLVGYTSDVITADFDGLNEGDSTVYEGTIADHDSGGGWFIKAGDIWKVASLGRAVEHFEESWFRNDNNPSLLDPDYIDAVRISSYAAWISDTIPQYVQGDLTGDDWVDFADFSVLGLYWLETGCESPYWCEGADFEPDGDVDWADLAFLTENWLNSISP